MEIPKLKDQTIFPSEEVLKDVMGNSYPAFEALTKEVTSEQLALTMEWRYYKDGKAWLCKVQFKKNNYGRTDIWR